MVMMATLVEVCENDVQDDSNDADDDEMIVMKLVLEILASTTNGRRSSRAPGTSCLRHHQEAQLAASQVRVEAVPSTVILRPSSPIVPR